MRLEETVELGEGRLWRPVVPVVVMSVVFWLVEVPLVSAVPQPAAVRVNVSAATIEVAVPSVPAVWRCESS